LKADKIGYSDLFFVIICFEYLISRLRMAYNALG